ncbi:MAG: type II secretion system protein [Planctomycetota bacterium]|jgi:prepilin-type N-terminal cleavage/methylation domain-containing protein/prepilin-type processing-associated H-X9-DG protein
MKHKAFTLVELLVVISVIVLLLALLFPALQGAKKRGQAVVCQSKLRQLGLILSIYSNENDGRAPWAGTDIWRLVLRTKVGAYPELALCPSATRPLPGPATSRGDTFHAASYLMGRRDLRASYGYNGWASERLVNVDGKMVVGTIQGKPIYWGRCDVKQAANIPAFFDCTGGGVRPSHWEWPPEYEAAESSDSGPMMADLCINRHSGGTNMGFLDWSVRKVGLKEHWTFKWSRQFKTAGVWTKAGGALPEDWPEWMRGFRDY